MFLCKSALYAIFDMQVAKIITDYLDYKCSGRKYKYWHMIQYHSIMQSNNWTRKTNFKQFFKIVCIFKEILIINNAVNPEFITAIYQKLCS